MDIVAGVLDQLCRINGSGTASLPPTSHPLAMFYSADIPKVGVREYMLHLRCPSWMWVIALMYMDKLGQLDPLLTVNESTVHRLLLASVAVATRIYARDSISYLSSRAGVASHEMVALESFVWLSLADDLIVYSQEFEDWTQKILRRKEKAHVLQEFIF